MEVILLGIYSFFVWLIFFKFKWLPWNIVSQVIVITLPIIGLTATILFLNIVAPSSSDVRVINYVVQVVPRVTGRVIEVPVEPNRPVKKGDVLFKIDPVPFEIELQAAQARVADLEAAVVGAQGSERELQEQLNTAISKTRAAESRLPGIRAQIQSATAFERELQEQFKSATGKRQSVASRMELARLRVRQFRELADSGAGNRFDLEQAEAEARTLEADLASAQASENQVTQQLSARTETGELAGIAQVRAQLVQAESDVISAKAGEAQIRQKLSARTPGGEIAAVAQANASLAQAKSQLADAQWKLDQTVYYAPADGTVVGLSLRPGAVASQLVMSPVMTFVENEQWVIALYRQNEVRKVVPGNEAEIALKTHPDRIIKCKVDSIMWATALGQLPISGSIPNTGIAPVPEGRLAVRLAVDDKDKDVFLAAGAQGQGAIFTESGQMVHIIRKVMLRVATKLDWLILKLH
jgi:multidrug resistance efflux pump